MLKHYGNQDSSALKVTDQYSVFCIGGYNL